MEFFLYMILMGHLWLLTWQDFRERMIAAWTLGVVLFIVCLLMFQQYNQALIWQHALYNSLFLVLQWSLLSLYFSIKSKQWVNLTKQHIGLGDILFFIPLVFLFSPSYFLLFYTSSAILILLAAAIYQCYRPLVTIPLAGSQAFLLSVALSYAQITRTDLHAMPFYTFF